MLIFEWLGCNAQIVFCATICVAENDSAAVAFALSPTATSFGVMGTPVTPASGYHFPFVTLFS